jgi:hypothetical protein
MKNIIIAAAMMPLFAFSQGAVTTKDSTWQVAANGAFYEVRQLLACARREE